VPICWPSLNFTLTEGFCTSLLQQLVPSSSVVLNPALQSFIGTLIDHIILDGNQAQRLNTPAASDCHSGNGLASSLPFPSCCCLPPHIVYAKGANNRMTGTNAINAARSVSLTLSVSMGALCASGFIWSGGSGYLGRTTELFHLFLSTHLLDLTKTK